MAHSGDTHAGEADRAHGEQAAAHTGGAAPRPGYADDKAALRTRLRRIEGQVRGLQRMVDEDTYCIDVLTQISAVNRALESVALALLDDHLHHCVSHAVAHGDDPAAKIDEATAAIRRLVRS